MTHTEELELLLTHYSTLTPFQHQQVERLFPLYVEWNQKINTISRKDIEHLYLHHVLHSMAITQVVRFSPGSRVADVGTGGGFPAIPLAILFPETHFLLIDSVGKKLTVARDVAHTIGLHNVSFFHSRAEEVKEKVDFVVSRAAMSLPNLVKCASHLIRKECINAMPNGFICLKGGDLAEELRAYRKEVEEYPLEFFFPYDYYKEKKIIYLPISL